MLHEPSASPERHPPSAAPAALENAVTTAQGRKLNGVDGGELRRYMDSVREDPSQADRDPEVTARWVGGTRAEVRSKAGGPAIYMGGDHDPSAMGMLLRALAACDIEVIVTRATLLGVELQDLSVEARGHFNVARYLGIDATDGAGLQGVSLVVRLRTTEPLTPEQLATLRDALETSPVGDTFKRHVPVELDLDAA